MSKQIQRDAVLERLQAGPATSWDLTVGLQILRPGARIFELRRLGFEIMSTEQMLQGKRIVTYWIPRPGVTTSYRVSVHERTDGVLVCTQCGRSFARKSKARPLRQHELPFCSDAHRAKYHREHKSTGVA